MHLIINNQVNFQTNSSMHLQKFFCDDCRFCTCHLCITSYCIIILYEICVLGVLNIETVIKVTDVGSRFVKNVGTCLQNCVASHHRTP